MSNNYSKHFNNKATPQTQAIPGSSQVQNSAGGFSFATSQWSNLNRFLILGSEGGSYYVGERQLTVENAKNTIKCIKEDGLRVVNAIVEVSDQGKAPKNDPAIFALALVATYGDEKAKKASYDAITKVCRTGTHLFTFCENIQALRGWSRGLRTGVAKFYTNSTVDKVAHQLIKYRQRNGWTHQDVLRLSHPKATSEEMNNLFKYAVGKGESNHMLVQAFERAQSGKLSSKEIVNLIREYNLPREALPTEFLNDKDVWEALLEKMPLTAMVRNLGKMTEVGLISSNSCDATKHIVSKLTDKEYVKKSRMHPLSLLVALKTYSSGGGFRGKLTWTPVTNVIDALNDAFYLAFENVESTGKRIMLALDVSGSMCSPMISGMNVSPREGSAAMALVTAATEKDVEIVGFTSGSNRSTSNPGISPLKISARQRLDNVIEYMNMLPFGGTDCSLPMVYALEKGLKIDTFIVYTDSETYAGRMHPVQALKEYRKKMNIPAKLIVVGMVSNGFTIADPEDSGMLDVVGFSTDTPAVISEFMKE
jgi:60 kDa SS-A/Ro ribonucleoprotein